MHANRMKRILPVVLMLLLCLAHTVAFMNFQSNSKAKALVLSAERGDASSLSNVGVVLLAGGKGKRMKAAMPKQFLPILGRPVFLRSLDVFSAMKCVSDIIIVLDESFRDEYEYLLKGDSRISWANPGAERQVSQGCL